MWMKFKSVYLYNFMSFKEETINFEDKGFTLVSGKNKNPDDSSSSNGSGKSSIWESILWCLTGETVRGTKDVVNLYGNDGALVTLNFDIDIKSYKITRSKDHSKLKTNLKIIIDGEDKSGKGIRDSEKLLQEYIPDLTSSLIGSVIILGQGLPQRFSNNTPSGRKQILEQLSKSDFMIEDIKTRIATRKLFWQKEQRRLEDELLELKTRLQSEEKFKKQCETELNSVPKKDDLELDLEKNQNTLNINMEILSKFDEVDYQVEIDKLTNQLLETSARKSEEADGKKLLYYDRLSELQKLSNDLRAEIISLESQIRKIDQIKDVCPTCGQKLIGVVKPDSSSLKFELEEKRTKKKEIDFEYKELELKQTSDLNEISSRYHDYECGIQQEIHEKRQLQKESQQKRDQITSKISSLKEIINGLSYKLNTLSSQIKDLAAKIKEYDSSLCDIQQGILYNNTETELVKKHQDVVTKMETYAKRDFRGILLTYVIDYINKKANEYSEIVYGSKLIEFTQEGNNINIKYSGKEYESLSGGEQKKLDIIIQLSIRDMLCKLLDFSCNILVCDEIFDALDLAGCQKIIDVITSKLTDVESIFIVTHRDNLSIPCDNEIIVVKDESKMSYVV